MVLVLQSAIGTVDAAFIMRYMSGTQQGNDTTGKYGPFPSPPAVHGVLQEFWDGIGWYRGTTATNTTNENKMMTYNLQYELGGGMNVAATYFDHEQTENHVTDTDVEGIMTR